MNKQRKSEIQDLVKAGKSPKEAYEATKKTSKKEAGSKSSKKKVTKKAAKKKSE